MVQCLPHEVTKYYRVLHLHLSYCMYFGKAFPRKRGICRCLPFSSRNQRIHHRHPGNRLSTALSLLCAKAKRHTLETGKNKGADGIAPTLLRKLAIRTSSILQSSAPTVCTRKCRLTLWNNFNRFFIDLCNVHQPGSTEVLLRGAALRLGQAIFSRVNKSCCMGKKRNAQATRTPANMSRRKGIF